MLRQYLKIWEWKLIFGHAVKAISSPGVRSPAWPRPFDFLQALVSYKGAMEFKCSPNLSTNHSTAQKSTLPSCALKNLQNIEIFISPIFPWLFDGIKVFP
jgi:hypothetical protein